MQKSLTELMSLPQDEVARLIQHLDEPLLITSNGEPQFVAQSLSVFESMVRRLRALEDAVSEQKPHSKPAGKVIPFRRRCP